jgi:hypothetical protein
VLSDLITKLIGVLIVAFGSDCVPTQVPVMEMVDGVLSVALLQEKKVINVPNISTL